MRINLEEANMAKPDNNKNLRPRMREIPDVEIL